MTEDFIQNVQFDLFSVELVIEDTATLSLAEDFIQNVQFDLFSVELIIGETATLMLAENYVTIREVFVDGVKVEPNESKQIFLASGGDDLWGLGEEDILSPKDNRTFTLKKAYEVKTETGDTSKRLNEQGDFTPVQITDIPTLPETLVRLEGEKYHPDLEDKNAEANYQHVNSTTTKETLVDNDKVVIYDSITGNLVLTNKTNVGVEIDDTTTNLTKTWSSQKISTDLNTKQPILVSGTNIKTINGMSVMGSGDIVVGGSTDITSTTANNTTSSVIVNTTTDWQGVNLTGSGNILTFDFENGILPTKNKEYLLIVTNNRSVSVTATTPTGSFVKNGITYSFVYSMATTPINKTKSAEFNVIFYFTGATTCSIRILINPFM